MAPSKPTLRPLQTPRNVSFPSELLDRPPPSSSPKSENGEDTATITPPPSYTEFLRILTPVYGTPTNDEPFSPRLPAERPAPSPMTLPSSAASSSFPTGNMSRNRLSPVHPYSPYSGPQSARETGPLRRLHIPASFVYSPSVASPQSAYSIRSPYSPSEWRRRYMESPRTEDAHSLVVRQVSTTTITFKRAPRINPPPEGKRRRTSGDQNSQA